MNVFANRLYRILLFSSILLSASIYSEYSSRGISWSSPGNYVSFTPYNNKSQGADFSSQRSSADYSCDSRWNDGGNHRSSVRANNFATYAQQDFQRHFARQGYTEAQILNQRCLYMFDDFVKFAQTYSSYNSTIKEIYAALKDLSFFQKVCCRIKGTYCRRLQKRIHYLYNELNTIKAVPQNNNYSSPVPIIQESPQVARQFEEYKVLELVYDTYAPSLANAIKTRSDTYSNGASADQALHYVRKSYNLNNNVKQLLSHYGHSTTRFAECYGNSLHQAIHQESLDILDRIEGLPSNSLLYDHQEALVDFAVAMVDYNHENMTDKAMTIGDFCWTLLDYGQAVGEGALLGAYSAVHDIIANPIEATVCIVAGKEILAYQLCKVLYNVADIGVTAITDVDCAKEKWNRYAEPLNNIIDAINKKEITLRDGIKGGTALVVGCKVQGKLLGGLGKFCNTIKQKSINFAKKSSLLNPQEYLTTPEGLLFKASSKSKSSGSGNAASKLKDTIDSKISKPSVLPTIVASGKGIICKGDLRAKIKGYEEHIFSPKHQRGGIFSLGKDKATIMDSLHDIIVSLDQKGLLKEGANQIKTAINGVNNVEIRCFIQDGEAISVNAYLSRFNRIYGNFIDVTKV